MIEATHLTRTLGQVMRAEDLPADWEMGIYDLHMFTQVPSWIAFVRASGSTVDATHRTTRLVTAGEILALQATTMTLLLTGAGGPDQNSASFSNEWSRQLPQEQIIREIHRAGTKTKKTFSIIQKHLEDTN